jgi:16S rRNA (cytosine967-C5)-methyltransferase
MVKRNGVLVYSTCTLTSEENEGVIETFLAEQNEFHLEDTSPFLPTGCERLVDTIGYLRTFPHCHGTDAFFAARMSRSTSIKI